MGPALEGITRREGGSMVVPRNIQSQADNRSQDVRSKAVAFVNSHGQTLAVSIRLLRFTSYQLNNSSLFPGPNLRPRAENSAF
jgi:hypothetical protein